MAKKNKSKDVTKFGGVDALGSVQLNGHTHEASSVEAQSQTHLEQDKGEGDVAIIRCFTFQMNLENPALFIDRNPSKQDLFNSHLRGIEMMLWKDGMKLLLDVPPRLTFDLQNMQYSIFIAARPMKGYDLQERPQTLTEIAHG